MSAGPANVLRDAQVGIAADRPLGGRHRCGAPG